MIKFIKSISYMLPAAVFILIMTTFVLRTVGDLSITKTDPPVTVYIPPNATLREVSGILYENEIISGKRSFMLWVRRLGLESKIRHGEYTFCGILSMKNIIDIIADGKVRLHRLTIPEGYSLKQIAVRVEELGLGSADEILKAAYDRQIISSLGLSADSLEGFCFPDTYLLPRDWTAEKILKSMVAHFWEIFDENMQKRAGEIGMTTSQVVTLASIIEKESGDRSELPLISAVFHNRLKKGIRLMADPSVIYGIENFSGNLTKSDLDRPGPYNLYLKKGLPPGPISNPGKVSLNAALYPAEVDYLYFVSKNNGTHYFSKNLSEHNRAVNIYQKAVN